MNTGPCKNHAEKAAVYLCTACKNYFCPGCVEIKAYRDFTFTAVICKACGGKCEEFKTAARLPAVSPVKKAVPQPDAAPAAVQAKEIPTNFWLEIVYNFIYPFM